MKGLKIGIPKEYRVDGMPDEIEALWQQGIAWLRDAGAEIVDISLPHTKYALPAYYIVAPAEASSNLARYDGVRYGLRVPGKDIIDMYEKTRAAGFGREVKRRILIGTYVLSAGYYDAYYLQAQKVRTLIKRDFETVFDAGVDAILTPATPSAAFGIADEDMAADPVKMYLNDIFTVTVNMAGLPGIAVPAGLDARRPAARPAADRPAVRRGDAVPDRACDRTGGGTFSAGEVVVGNRLARRRLSDNMLGLAKRLKCTILQASTSEVYGDPVVHPQTEDYWGNVNPIGPRSCYDEGKRCAETLFFDYHRQHGVADQGGAHLQHLRPAHAPPDDGRVVSNFIVQALRGRADHHLWRRQPDALVLLCRRPGRRADAADGDARPT